MDKVVKKKLSLWLTLEENADLEIMAKSAGTTKSNILRKAVDLYAIALKAKQQGRSLAEVEDQKVISTIVVL